MLSIAEVAHAVDAGVAITLSGNGRPMTLRMTPDGHWWVITIDGIGRGNVATYAVIDAIMNRQAQGWTITIEGAS